MFASVADIDKMKLILQPVRGAHYLVLHDVILHDARVGVVPLVGGESGHHKEGEGDQHVGG